MAHEFLDKKGVEIIPGDTVRIVVEVEVQECRVQRGGEEIVVVFDPDTQAVMEKPVGNVEVVP